MLLPGIDMSAVASSLCRCTSSLCHSLEDVHAGLKSIAWHSAMLEHHIRVLLHAEDRTSRQQAQLLSCHISDRPPGFRVY